MSDGDAVADASAEPTPSDGRAQLSVLLVEVGDAVHALEAGYVDHVAEEFTVTRIPRTPSLVAGVGEIENETTVVVDVRQALGASAATQASRRVVRIHRESGDRVGLLVDDVQGFERADLSDIAPVDRSPADESGSRDAGDDVGETSPTNWFRATIEPTDSTREEPIGVLDVPYLLQRVATTTRRDTHE